MWMSYSVAAMTFLPRRARSAPTGGARAAYSRLPRRPIAPTDKGFSASVRTSLLVFRPVGAESARIPRLRTRKATTAGLPAGSGAALALVHRLHAGDGDGVAFLDQLGAE